MQLLKSCQLLHNCQGGGGSSEHSQGLSTPGTDDLIGRIVMLDIRGLRNLSSWMDDACNPALFH